MRIRGTGVPIARALLRASLVIVIASTTVTACGADSEQQSSAPTCPTSTPLFTPCTDEGLFCKSATDCTGALCHQGQWVPGGCSDPGPVCPEPATLLPEPGSSCAGYGGGMGACAFSTKCGASSAAQCTNEGWQVAWDPCSDGGVPDGGDEADVDDAGDAALDAGLDGPDDAGTG